MCHIQGWKSGFIHVHATNNWYAGFIDIIIKLTSVAWKLFPSTWWVYRAHCMKNLELVWSRWSPADHNLFQLVVGAEKVVSISKVLPKNFQDYATRCWRFTSNLWRFYGDLVAIRCLWNRFRPHLSCYWHCIASGISTKNTCLFYMFIWYFMQYYIIYVY